MQTTDGFTLMEIMVALVIAVMVLVAAHTAFVAIADQGEAFARMSARQDGEANAWEWLRILVRRMRTAGDAASIVGTDSTVNFSSWCESPHGWLEPCSVSLSVDHRDSLLRVASSTGLAFAVLAVPPTHLRYYVIGKRSGVLASSWNSTFAPPDAIAVLTGADTLLFGIGDRG